MTGYAAFLRGMNLGRRRISNAELAAAVSALGFEAVRTFRASGNVMFEAADGDDPDELGVRFEAGLAEALGYPVPTFVRSAAEVRAIAGHRPFAESTGADGGKLQVALVAREPASKAAADVLAMDCAADRIALAGRELYWLPIGRMSDSELDLKAIERLLGGTTIRTMGTIEQIAERMAAG